MKVNILFDDLSSVVGGGAICRGGTACPPILVRALYVIRADTQVRPYISLFVSFGILFFVYSSSVSMLICVQPETSTSTAAVVSSGSSSVRSRRGVISVMSSVFSMPGLVFIEKSGER